MDIIRLNYLLIKNKGGRISTKFRMCQVKKEYARKERNEIGLHPLLKWFIIPLSKSLPALDDERNYLYRLLKPLLQRDCQDTDSPNEKGKVCADHP